VSARGRAGLRTRLQAGFVSPLNPASSALLYRHGKIKFPISRPSQRRRKRARRRASGGRNRGLVKEDRDRPDGPRYLNPEGRSQRRRRDRRSKSNTASPHSPKARVTEPLRGARANAFPAASPQAARVSDRVLGKTHFGPASASRPVVAQEGPERRRLRHLQADRCENPA